MSLPFNSTSREHSEGFVRLSLAAPFLQYLTERKINPQPALDQVGLKAELMTNPSVFVHSELVYGLVNAFSEVSGDRYLGLNVGEAFDLQGWPPFAQALQSTKTLFEFFTRFVELVPQESNSVRHSLVIEADKATYRIERQQEPTVPPIQVTGFGAAIYVRLLQTVVGESWDSSRVRWESRYINGLPIDYKGIEVGLGTDPGMQISFPVEWLFLHHVSEGSAKPIASLRQDEEVTVVAALRSVLRDKLDETDLGPEMVAGMLGIQPERFLKALQKQGTTLPREIKRLRIDVAKEHLKQNQMTIAEIGLMLGYSDKSHFTRFFRGQTGMTPTKFRSK
ncbi:MULTISPECIES: AraC family transcriptional regulator [Ruegeria]|uniref:helix-turn-helix domain-containing protein n=2 Tax=Roseobacteraceae TaxID=2854170 RepID=UPI00147D287D|nr:MULTISPECIES: AraC family transcriptional regulator [Ruegeria]MBY6083812.1 AraC family transcriptional regulator [Ruegeria arenilitoris]NOC93364.1 helix-turn-helix domain-containing protein [Ruegeria sp. HKCCD6604]NOD70211.1 helix-turn-helix domain-containing protein [Ruegeria sp. HKCCD7303]NOD98522.1 helix-turn-helix domain-containing protein [Ruegeria sp. HKCCD6228]NOE34457.1 helix-turn-helix domain-containing protein [Ruegeria sp. HKCCD7318]